MFNLNKALLSILILSGLTVKTTQPIDWSWATNSSIYKTCAPYGGWLLKKAKEHKNDIAGCLVISCGVVMLIRNYHCYVQGLKESQKRDRETSRRLDQILQDFDK